MSKQLVSIIIPCRNEEHFIYNVLKSIENQSISTEQLEVIIGDGESDDQTVQEIERFKSDHPALKIELINNPFRVVPHALNACLDKAKGDVIVRLDAHSEYPQNYIERLLEVLEQYPDAWNVGGVWDTQAGADTYEARAIVQATSHKVGIGNADYRLENDEIKSVDTVPFGCFRKEVFEKIGKFDEELIRNQDDEFNGRIIKNGGKIYLVPDLKIKYYARATFDKLGKMFYQYGFFKPLVNKKLGAPATSRQFAPLALVLGVLVGWIPALIWFPFIWLYIFGLMAYVILLLVTASTVASTAKIVVPLTISFIIIHFSYGWGYLRGIFKFLLLNQRIEVKTYDTSR